MPDYVKSSTLVRVFKMSKLGRQNVKVNQACIKMAIVPLTNFVAQVISYLSKLQWLRVCALTSGTVIYWRHRPHCPHLRFCAPLCSIDIRRNCAQQTPA